MSPKKYLYVVCAIIEHGGKFLAAKRSHAQSHGGFWEFPGGKIGPDEDPDTAIAREIKEETGGEIIVVSELDPVTFDYPDKTVLLIPLVCKTESATFSALEHEELRWVDLQEAETLDWLPPDKELLQKYKKNINVR
jgi:8-oxo-dGTP diphosphatase